MRIKSNEATFLNKAKKLLYARKLKHPSLSMESFHIEDKSEYLYLLNAIKDFNLQVLSKPIETDLFFESENPIFTMADLEKFSEQGVDLEDEGIFVFEGLLMFYEVWKETDDSPNKMRCFFGATDGNTIKFIAKIESDEFLINREVDFRSSSEFMIDEDFYKSLRFPERTYALYKFLCFKKLIKHDVKTIKNIKGSKSAKKKGNSKSNLTVDFINKTYFTSINVINGFQVRGHWRRQPCGKGRKDWKWKYIAPFKKNGYHRKATILKSE